jgi:manganese/zinc/iron transport system permease protein
MGLAALALLAAAMVWLFFKEFRLLAFDEAFARAAGWPTGRIDVALMALVTLVTVVGLQTVGLVLIIALLITPAATARFWTDDLASMLIIAGGVGAVSGGFGALLSSRFADLPAGAIIVLVATTLFFISLIMAPSRGLLGRTLRRARLRKALRAGEMVP